MDDMPLVSVLIPIYNSERYLRECIASVISQSYENLEIVLVNDGSTDGSLEICKYFAEKDSRIVVVDKENGGVGSARNAAVDNAHGEYVAFIDSDDIVHKDYIQLLLQMCLKYNCEISYCDFITFEDEKNIQCRDAEVNLDSEKLEYVSCLDALENMYALRITPLVWGKMFKRKLFGSLRFKDGQRAEDLDMFYKLIFRSDYVAGVKYLNLYYFRAGHQSIMNKISSKSTIDFDYRLHMYWFIESLDCFVTMKKLTKQTMRFYFDMLCTHKDKISDYPEFKKKMKEYGKLLADEMFYKKGHFIEKRILKISPYLWKYYQIIKRKFDIKLGKETLY